MYIERGQGFFDVTPIRYSATTNDPFVTGSAGSSVVTVTYKAHGANSGDFVTFSGASILDGILAATLNRNYSVTVVNANQFTSVASPCTAGAQTGGGAVTAAFEVHT